ncbi:hypothetical protein G6F40_017062 [Rhizopus arrhizus]|nr:hypothetical protein G6F40_017062 [Rhizopus arrhizus]
MGKGNTLTVAAEAPKTELAGATEERAAVNRLPDVTVTARMERDWGHLQLGAVARSLAYDGDGERDRRMAGGLQLRLPRPKSLHRRPDRLRAGCRGRRR